MPFRGHATIATAVALARRDGVGATVFETRAGELEVRTSQHDGGVAAAFTSVEPRLEELPDEVLDGLLRIVGLVRSDLHPGYPPRSVFAGNVHPLVVLADVAALDRLRTLPTRRRDLESDLTGLRQLSDDRRSNPRGGGARTHRDHLEHARDAHR